MDRRDSDKSSHPSLWKRLDDETRTCELTNNKYIPPQILLDVINAPAVANTLRLKRNWMRSNRGIENETNVQGMERLIAALILSANFDEKSLKALSFNGLTDNDLPLSVDGTVLKSRFQDKQVGFTGWEEASFSLFQEKQWMVMPLVLDLRDGQAVDVDPDEMCALELDQCEVRYHTGSGAVYYALVPPLGEKEKPRPVAIKKFLRHEVSRYDKEKNNLARISNIKNNHLIKYLAACRQIPCIVFPWAEYGDLREFWNKESTSERTLDVFDWSLQQLAGIASALKELHAINCRHGDLKPSNILCFNEDGARVLKIADFGGSKILPFLRKGEIVTTARLSFLRQGETVPTARTRAYEAPEAYRVGKTGAPRSRNYDCWSMGCIIMEFVIWMLYDYRALECFHRSRDSEWSGYYRPKKPQFQQGDDGQREKWWEATERHPNVDVAIDLLREDARVKGTVLEDLVDLVDLELLKLNHKERLLAAGIDKRFQGALDKFKQSQKPLVNDVPRPPVPTIFSQLPPQSWQTTSELDESTSEASQTSV